MIFFNILAPLLLTFSLIYYIRFMSVKYNIFMDHPKKRGQHQISKPRSGGICFFLALILFFIFDFYSEKNIPFYMILIFLFYSNLYFLIGLYDDYQSLNFKIKLLFQIISSITTIIIIKLFFDFDIRDFYIYVLLVFFFSIAFTNINNFMDGTDTIVTTNFIFFVIISILFSIFYDHIKIISFLIWLLIISLVFLFYNFPPSKIFLGDSGSYFLGSIVVMIVCYFAISDLRFVLIFLNIYSFFLVDTSLTLFNRFKNKENIFKAHNKHLYQKLSFKNNKLFSINYIAYMIISLIIICLTMLYDILVIFTFLNYIFLALFYYILKKNEISQ